MWSVLVEDMVKVDEQGTEVLNLGFCLLWVLCQSSGELQEVEQ